jgi:1,6-anhydro-N-acetylmuramate kinase
MAKAGQSDETSIHGWLQEPYFQSPPPKSTGRELFGRANLQQRLNNLGQGCSNQDAVATLTSFSAAVVAQDLEQLMQRDQIRPLELIVAGGGPQPSADGSTATALPRPPIEQQPRDWASSGSTGGFGVCAAGLVASTQPSRQRTIYHWSKARNGSRRCREPWLAPESGIRGQ